MLLLLCSSPEQFTARLDFVVFVGWHRGLWEVIRGLMSSCALYHLSKMMPADSIFENSGKMFCINQLQQISTAVVKKGFRVIRKNMQESF